MRSACFKIVLGATMSINLPGLCSSAMAQAAPASAVGCKVDDKIAASDRSSVDALSLAVARNMLVGNEEALRGQMSEVAGSATSPSALAQDLRFIKMWLPYQDVHVAHTYQIDLQGSSNLLPEVLCGRSPKDTDAMILSTAAVPRQFYVEVMAHTMNNDWSIFIGLFGEKGVLKALSWRFSPSAISGRTSPILRKLALEQVSRGHEMNAVLLYQAAEGVADRGPNAVPIWRHALDVEAAGLRFPQELSLGSGGTLRFADHTFSASNVSILGVGGDLDLQFFRHADQWPDDDTIDSDNRSFITAVVKDYPELPDSFAAILVSALRPDGNSGFTTVYQFGKGFSQPPATSARH